MSRLAVFPQPLLKLHGRHRSRRGAIAGNIRQPVGENTRQTRAENSRDRLSVPEPDLVILCSVSSVPSRCAKTSL